MSGITIKNFRAYETVPLNATTASSSVTFKLPGSPKEPDCLVTNAGSVTAFVGFFSSAAPSTMAQFGSSAKVPGTNGTLQATPVLAGETMVLDKNNAGGNFGSDSCCAITSTGSAQLYFTSGTGS